MQRLAVSFGKILRRRTVEGQEAAAAAVPPAAEVGQQGTGSVALSSGGRRRARKGRGHVRWFDGSVCGPDAGGYDQVRAVAVCCDVCVCVSVLCVCVQCACAQPNMHSFTTAHNVCIQAFVACVLACKCKATGSALTSCLTSTFTCAVSLQSFL